MFVLFVAAIMTSSKKKPNHFLECQKTKTDILKKWIIACKRMDLDEKLKSYEPEYFYKNYAVCSDHFEMQCFKNPKLHSQGLRPGSLATLNLFNIPTVRKRKSLNRALYDIRNGLKWKASQFILTTRSLTYNEHMSQSYAIDFIMEPVFWFVDNFAKYLGKVFVFCVTVMTAAVVFIAYWVGLPYWWERSPYMTIFLVLFGNWLLCNILFHYYKGVMTSPGYPPHGTMIAEAASICKKCISPKPPRTHHCSVCDRCILGMDHHCPWLNNCVGYFNARYFYLYMVYMVTGVLFVIIAGIDIGYVVLWLNDTGGIVPNNDPDLIGHPVHMNQSGVLVPVKSIAEYDSDIAPRIHELPVPVVMEAQRIAADPWKRKAVVFMAITCVSVLIALGILAVMHAKNISRGETSVEAHVNATQRKKLGKNFRNPYDFGRRKNWRLFLGLTQGRSFFRHVLIPSGHSPNGNGLMWHSLTNRLEDWP